MKKKALSYLVCAFLILAPLLLVSAYNRPCADDYDYAILTHEAIQNGGGLLSVIKAAWTTNAYFYNSWQGLYTSAFLLALQPGIWGESYYAFSSIIILAFSFLLLWGAVHRILKRTLQAPIAYSAIWAAWILAVLFNFLPDATQGLYWYNGAMNYTPWAFADCLVVALIYETYFCKDVHKVALVLVTSLLAFIISGANHVTAFENIFILGVVCIWMLFAKKRAYGIAPLGTAVLGFFIMYQAPGTAVRQAALEKETVWNTLVQSFIYTKNLVISWINLPWLIILLTLTPLLLQILDKTEQPMDRKRLLFVPVISFGLLWAMNCVPYYAMGFFGDGRLVNVIWIAFIGISVYNYFLFLQFFKDKGWLTFPFEKSPIRTSLVIGCTALIFLIPQSNSLKAFKDIASGKAKNYAAEVDQRIEMYKGDMYEISVSPIQNRCILYFSDIGCDPDVWPNTSISKYYNKRIYLDSAS